MRTLIVPCSGKSSRFENMRPKYLLTYPDGCIMVEKAISGIDLDKFDRVIITIVKEHCDRYESDLILKQIFNLDSSPKIELCILPNFTSCQSETVFQTIVDMNVKGQVVVKDSDNYLEIDRIPTGCFIVGVNIRTFAKEIYRLSAKSYLMVNDQGIITDIIEKEIKSECICVGMYGFSDSDLYCSAYLNIINELKWDSKNELYLSHIISYMIGTKKSVFEYVPAIQYEDWGTPQDWQIVQNAMQTYFIDFDGVIVKNRGRCGSKNWDNDNEVIEENIFSIKEKYDAGAQIVITTARPREHIGLITEIFKKYGIALHAIVSNCNHSSRIIINDFAPSNPFPSCSAISIPRDSCLKDYLKK